ncbi:MAG: DUF3108 domain-containing protein [Pseudomonadota bacterium]|nr:DUF3108 domain-containing protein [Pseudomonadota bacterium]
MASSRPRTLLGFAVLALLLHAAFLGGVDGAAPGRIGPRDAGVPIAVRLVEATPGEDAAAPAVAAVPTPLAASPAPAPRPRPALRGPRTVSAPASAAAETRPRQLSSAEESTSEPTERALPPAESASQPVPLQQAEAAPDAVPSASPDANATATAAAGPAASDPGTGTGTGTGTGAGTAAAAASGAAVGQSTAPVAASASAPSLAASASFLAEGEAPPPTYRTALPAPATMHYEVRRGFLRGTGEIRWQRSADGYELRLEARIAGLTLLTQTSQGTVDATGLAPVRFLDQRARRAPQAANFRRDSDNITFSGPATVWPLLAGTQDQLSWMIQLAGIVAAEPERATEGGRIAMVIVGARGDAAVRTLRFAGRETVETASGAVAALKFVVDGRSTYDASYEIWLDPAHGYLPAHATRRNGAGESEFDLLLERIEPPP